VQASDSGLVLREDDTKHSSSSSSTITVALELPDELPRVEDTLETSTVSVPTERVLDLGLVLIEEGD
jgi:hypothetical protein